MLRLKVEVILYSVPLMMGIFLWSLTIILISWVQIVDVSFETSVI